MHPLRLLPAVLLATCCAAFAKPNEADLSAFKGNFKGTGSVQTSASTFKGKSKLRGAVPGSGKSLKLTVKASVDVSGNDVAIDNEFKFTKSGLVKGKELAPGDTSGVKFKGRYKATPNEITFQGKWKLGSASGTFDGTVKVNNKGVIEAEYSVFVGESEDPTYVYTYKGK